MGRVHAALRRLRRQPNLAYGFDSARAEACLGRPANNTAIHAGLGLRFMLISVAPFVAPGDLILIVPEYEQLEAIVDGEVALGRLMGSSRAP